MARKRQTSAEREDPPLKPNMLISNVQATSSTFDRTSFDNSIISKSDYSNSLFNHVTFESSTFDNVSFDGSIFKNCNFRHASFENCDIDGLVINGIQVGDLLKLLYGIKARGGKV